MKEIVVGTRNLKKLREIKRLLGNSGIKTISLRNFPNPPEVIEDRKTFKGNAVKKAKVLSRFTGRITLADDSGLEVKALGGKPGVRSARYSGPKKNDFENNKKLLKALKNNSGRSARFRCVVAMAENGKLLKITEGVSVGKIGFDIKGKTGFGYDPVFVPSGFKKTFAELGPSVKDKLSHRSKALKKAADFIRGYL